MTISIVDNGGTDDTNNHYDVRFFSDRIKTLVTHNPRLVANWLSEIERFHRRRLSHLIVGFDVEWRPNFYRNQNNPVATLQLCVGRRCLIFQILLAVRTNNNGIPRKLIEFLGQEGYTFVGVGIHNDVEKLEEDYGISVGGRTVDLGLLAAAAYNNNALKKAGLKALASLVLERDFEKPKRISMSKWDNMWLTDGQVQYACVDAFVSFEIGRSLDASMT